jgi:hypothetical protein
VAVRLEAGTPKGSDSAAGENEFGSHKQPLD